MIKSGSWTRQRTGRLWATVAVFKVCALALPAAAQWDPANAQWGKSDDRDIRVMTWNVKDGVCSTNAKSEGLNNWTALARIVAALRPDVLLLQEAGDNSGNGTGAGVDSVSALSTTLQLFLGGGGDPFLPGNPPVTAYVQKYAPNYDLPFVFVSNSNDGFNRNVILSRFPFADLNGDGRSVLNDIHLILGDEYAPGGNGGIRGFPFVELDLPDADYDGDLVVGAGHLKAGGSSSDLADRLEAAQNVAYWVDYLLNGAGTGTPDPNGKILDSPPVTSILDPLTPVILGGDWNEDEATNGRRGPAEWLTAAAMSGGSDGTDRDRTDMIYDAATHVFTGSRATFGSSSKLDYLAWQDSIIELRRAFIFNTSGTPGGALPPELSGFPAPSTASGVASDHRPVIADFIFVAPDCNDNGVPDDQEPDTDGDGVIDDCDGCPLDETKIEPGLCGCGIPETDSDSDGTPDCLDECPNDPAKIAPGLCGCGTPDDDSDGDSTPDCLDECPNDPNKTAPGQCGCGAPDVAPEAPQLVGGGEWRKNRYLSFVPPGTVTPYAFQVRRTFPGNDDLGWVGIPAGNDLAGIVADSVVRVWSEPVVHVGGCGIVPVAVYEVTSWVGSCVSAEPLIVVTIDRPVPKFWGDTVGAFDGTNWSPPNGLVNTNDFLAALQLFQGVPGAPHVSVVDVQSVSTQDPCLNGIANIADIFLLIKAFQGEPYPFEMDPENCPVCP